MNTHEFQFAFFTRDFEENVPKRRHCLFIIHDPDEIPVHIYCHI